jgi:hypothetical protein
MLKNMMEPERTKMMTQYGPYVACWIGKATRARTHKYVIFIALFTAKIFRKNTSVLCYTYIACLVCKTLAYQAIKKSTQQFSKRFMHTNQWTERHFYYTPQGYEDAKMTVHASAT